MRNTRRKSLVGAILAGSLMFSSTAAVAATSTVSSVPVAAQVNPWASLAALSGAASAVAMCGSSATLAAAAGAVAPGGCVLPQVDAAPAVAQVAPPQPIPVPPVDAPSSFYLDPLVLALGALAIGALVYFLVIKKKNNNSPNSPA